MNEADASAGEEPDLVLAGRYHGLARAHEHMLVVLAMQFPCWLLESAGDYEIYVEPAALGRVRDELSLYDAEQRERLRKKSLPEWRPHPLGLWWAFAWIVALLAVFLWQGQDPRVVQIGAASARKIIDAHELWRALTAQFLHSDIEHLGGNLLFGLLYGLLAARTLGAGLAWTLILASGYLANVLTAAFYFPQDFTSIGASTAVFGAWGLLTGCGVYVAFRSPDHEPWAQVIIPLGGGLALLGWLGMGGGSANVDVLGHVAGFLCGGVLGALAAMARLRQLRR